MEKYALVVLIDDDSQMELFNERFSPSLRERNRLQLIALDRSANDKIGERVYRLTERANMEYHRIPAQCPTADAYNLAFEWIDAEYICFATPNSFFCNAFCDALDDARRTHPLQQVLAFKPKKLIEELEEEPEEKEKEVLAEEYQEAAVRKIALTDAASAVLFPASFFFSAKVIGDTRFNADCGEDAPSVFMLEVLAKAGSYANIVSEFAYYDDDVLSLSPNKYLGCYDKSFYTASLVNGYEPLLDRYATEEELAPLWLQKTVLALLYRKYVSNKNASNKFIIIADEIDAFFDETSRVLQKISDEAIVSRKSYNAKAVDIDIINMFMWLKYRGDEETLNRTFFIEGSQLRLSQADTSYSFASRNFVTIRAISVQEDALFIEGFYSTDLLYQFDPNALYADVNGKRIDLERTLIYSHNKVFARTIGRKYTFQFLVEKADLCAKKSTLGFFIEIDGNTIAVPIRFDKPAARLNHTVPSSFWVVEDNLVMTYTKPTITFERASRKQIVKMSAQYSTSAALMTNDTKLRNKVLKTRALYYAQEKRLRNKHIWIYFDKLYKGGDNGEYQFRHDIALEKQDGIECYYILDKSAHCYPAMKKEFGNRILEFGSQRCLLYTLCADVIMATGPDIIEFCGFDKEIKSYFRDIFNAKLVCIAHGVTIQKNAEVQNRLYDNTQFYTTSSKYEVKHLEHPVYGYDDSHIALTGMARFDGLKNNDQRQILITPTWRNNLVSKRTSRAKTRDYSSEFKNSDYFRIYNSLINDQRLIEAAKETGYRIVFLVHPLMTAQICDYDTNDYVELMLTTGETSYEKILTESSLMVTDYSGVHYDFGFMKKPVVYYQPKEIPPRFEEGAMHFETMGFGPVTPEYDEAIDLICDYMRKDCQLEQEYIDRVDDFFEYTDRHNCDRIHDAVHAWVASQKQ